jgi:hypothetical protein
MALFHCPVCGLPLTDAEARLSSCAACGGSLTAPPVAAQPAATPAPPTPAAPHRRTSHWLIGTTATAVAAIVLLLLWQWREGQAEPATTDPGPAPAPAPVAKADPKPLPAPKPPAPKPPIAADRAEVNYPSLAATAKAPGDGVTDGDIGARAKPADEPKRDGPAPPRVAEERPAPARVPPMFQLPPEMPVFPNPPFGGNLGGRGIADNDIDQLLRMALTQQQELEKLFKMAGMQDLDLLNAARAIQGFGNMQGLGQRRPVFGGTGGPAPGKPASDGGEMVLTGNGISDRDLERLRGQVQLRGLSLAGTAVTDAGMDYVKGLKGLRRLNLSSTHVTDKGLEALHGLTELRDLDLSNTRVTDAGSRRLQEALPNLEITR